jgi:hypothetical protein
LTETAHDAKLTSFRRAGVWLLRSGIQEENGGVARYYRSDQRRNARISLEITGYAVSTLLYFHRRTGQGDYLARALDAANLLRKAGPLYPFELARPGEEPCQHAYFFDSGIIVRGLLAAWRQTGDRAWLDAASAAGHTMIHAFMRGGMPQAIVRLASLDPLPDEERWAGRPGCYQLKAAAAWRWLYEETADVAFLDAWEESLDLCLQARDRFLPGDSDPRKIMDRLHAYCYFLEGLLHAADREPCARAIVEGIDRVGHYLRQIEDVFVRSDVYAQLLRLRIYAANFGLTGLAEPHAAREAVSAASFQLGASDAALNGGFAFGRDESGLMPYVNPSSTAFCAQALELWERRSAAALDPHDLI